MRKVRLCWGGTMRRFALLNRSCSQEMSWRSLASHQSARIRRGRSPISNDLTPKDAGDIAVINFVRGDTLFGHFRVLSRPRAYQNLRAGDLSSSGDRHRALREWWLSMRYRRRWNTRVLRRPSRYDIAWPRLENWSLPLASFIATALTPIVPAETKTEVLTRLPLQAPSGIASRSVRDVGAP
jgi:hypothetical protein